MSLAIVPSTHQSSNTCYNGRITKQGSALLRWILVQCAHASIKSRISHRLKRFYLRIARKKGDKKAVVATARKMLTIIWHLLNKNQYYEASDLIRAKQYHSAQTTALIAKKDTIREARIKGLISDELGRELIRALDNELEKLHQQNLQLPPRL